MQFWRCNGLKGLINYGWLGLTLGLVVSGFGLIQPKFESNPTRMDLGRIRTQFFYKLGRILDLSNFTDLDLGVGSALTLSRFRIWTWIQFLLQFGLD